MSVRAEWRLAELLKDDGDPFAAVILSSGLTVDLTGTEQEIAAGLKESLLMESRLFNRGVTCELKDGGQDCLTCAMYVADRAEEQRAPLCRLGRDQRVLEERHKELRAEPYGELIAEVEVCTELGHLSAEYEDLLTAVGL